MSFYNRILKLTKQSVGATADLLRMGSLGHREGKIYEEYCRDFSDRLLIKTPWKVCHDYDQAIDLIKLPPVKDPIASIIVCNHNKLNFTLNCLYSLNQVKNSTPFEVILVDDQSTDESPIILPKIGNLKYFYNEKNLGFLKSSNLGAIKARGEYLVFLNNDTIVTDYWLDKLIDFLSQENVGLVGSKLLFPNGTLQEAGSVIFSSGDAWNYGGGQNPYESKYMVSDEVTYCSGASLAIKKKLFFDLNKFDEQFAPIYYEDTDLAFTVRQQGLRVFFVADSVVYHLRGITQGRGKNGGVLDLQILNKKKFVMKWKDTLSSMPRDITEAEALKKYSRLLDEMSLSLQVEKLVRPIEISALGERVYELGVVIARLEYLYLKSQNDIRQLTELYTNSWSWRLTKPLRIGFRWFEIISGWSTSSEIPSNDCQPIKTGEKKSSKNILVIDHYIPTFDQDAGSRRMFNLLKIFIDLGYNVIFWSVYGQKMEPYTSALLRAGIVTLQGTLSDHLEMEGDNYGLVILSRLHIADEFGELVKKYCPRAQVIYDSADLGYVRESRRAQVEDDKELMVSAFKLKELEIKVTSATDLTFVASENEKQILERECPNSLVEALPVVWEVRPQPLFVNKKDLLYIGGFSHSPNVDAVKYFVAEIFPLIKQQIPEVVFYILGSKPPDDIINLSTPDIIVTGYVPDVSDYFDHCRVAVAPLRYGAGVKGKITHTMSYGIPTVTTAIGAEGMNLTNEVDILIADDPKEFADKVISLYTDERFWRVISENSLKNIGKYYNFEVVRGKVKFILDKLLSR